MTEETTSEEAVEPTETDPVLEPTVQVTAPDMPTQLIEPVASEPEPEVNDEAELEAAELEALKSKAKLLGITFHPNIKAQKLQERITQHIEKNDESIANVDEAIKQAQNKVNVEDVVKDLDPAVAARVKAKADALSLVRIRATCMDPSKKEYDCQIFTAGNSVVGTVSKCVPFEKDFHVPRIIFNVMKDATYQAFVKTKTPGGAEIKKGKQVKAFSVAELEPLTAKELEELRQRQLIARQAS